MGSRRLRCWISPLGLRPLFAIQHHSATNRYFSVNYCRLLLQFAIKILNDTVETNGVGEFKGVLKFSIPELLYARINDGFLISEVDEKADGWTYSTQNYYIIPQYAIANSLDNASDGLLVDIRAINLDENGEPIFGEDEEQLENAVFENSYNKANDPTPPTPPANTKNDDNIAKSPKTGDRGITVCAVMLFAGICLAGISVILKKKV